MRALFTVRDLNAIYTNLKARAHWNGIRKRIKLHIYRTRPGDQAQIEWTFQRFAYGPVTYGRAETFAEAMAAITRTLEEAPTPRRIPRQKVAA